MKKKKTTTLKDRFIAYVNDYVTFADINRTKSGAYLVIDGGIYDGGNISDNGLQDSIEVKFDKPETVDKYFTDMAKELGYRAPKYKFSEYVK